MRAFRPSRVNCKCFCLPVLAAQEPPPQIPEWLPALPDRHTYVATPSYAGHDTDAKRQRLAATKAKRQVPTPSHPPPPHTPHLPSLLAPGGAASEPFDRPVRLLCPVPGDPKPALHCATCKCTKQWSRGNV